MERANSTMVGSQRGRVALRVLAGLLGLLCWLGGAGHARAAGTFVVDGANPGCSDTAPGAGTEGNPPYCTISAAAVARGGPGTTLLVKPAIYRELVNVPASGAEGSPFTFQALGPGVVVDGADDFASPAQWTLFSGNVWLAKNAAWSPTQVFVDGARLSASTTTQAELPAGTFRHVLGEGLYVNLGGDNPGTHQTLVGRRDYGFHLFDRSWVTIDGFTVTRTSARGIYAREHSDNTVFTNNTLSFTGRGIDVQGPVNVLIGSNVVSDCAAGIHVIRTQSSKIQDNQVFRNGGHGIELSYLRGSVLQRNRLYENQGTGLKLRTSVENTISLQNLSWNNGRDGFELALSVESPGNLHIGDVAWGNGRRGFSVEGTATNTHIFNSIAVNNGLTTGGYNLFVDSTSAAGFVSNSNIFWNSTSQTLIRYSDTKYATIATFTAATGQDAASLQADPRFLHPEVGDFRLLPGSPAIDAADSSVPDWPATDAAGQGRVDDPATPDTGTGPVPYADRGALEFLPAGPPLAALTVTPSSGTTPLAVTADASRSVDPDGTIVSYLFDFGDGTAPVQIQQPDPPTATHTYTGVGTFTVTVTVTDDESGTASASALVKVAPPNQPPVAALTLTPTSGTAPLAVTADAAGSVDPDGRIVSYRFDFGDGKVVGPQPEATASHTYEQAGALTVTVTVTDDKGATGSATATVTVTLPPSVNLVGNPSFESDTQGWAAYGGATIQRVPGGVDGAFALEVRGSGSTTEFGINDSPNWVATSGAAGTRYRFSAWVRSTTSSARARLKVREYLNGAQVGGATTSAALALTPAWQLLVVEHVTQAASSTLDFQVLGTPLATGAVFEVDDIAIRIVTTTTNQPPNGVIDSPAGNVTITTGQSVTFTGTGNDPDGNLPLTYRWDFGGGAPGQTVEDPGPVVFSTLGTYTVRFTVTDSLGVSDPTPDSRVITVQEVGSGPNLVGNPSFETDTSGWKPYPTADTVIERVPGGQDGAFALKVRGPATMVQFGINDSPNWVGKTPAAGARYRFMAWWWSPHRGDRLRVREYLNGALVAETISSPVPSLFGWQPVTLDHITQAAGSTLDFQVLNSLVLSPGEEFLVDNIAIVVVP